MIETIALVLTGLSITASIFYYANIIQNADKARQREQLQIRIQSADLPYTRAWTNVMFKKAPTREEWAKIYNPFTDPDLFADMIFIQSRFQSIGVMLREGFIEPELLFKIYSPHMIMVTWEHYLPNIIFKRKEVNDPNLHSDFEYLYKETKKRFPDIIAKTRDFE